MISSTTSSIRYFESEGNRQRPIHGKDTEHLSYIWQCVMNGGGELGINLVDGALREEQINRGEVRIGQERRKNGVGRQCFGKEEMFMLELPITDSSPAVTLCSFLTHQKHIETIFWQAWQVWQVWHTWHTWQDFFFIRYCSPD